MLTSNKEPGVAKVVITIWDHYVASRFDQATEALVATLVQGEVTAMRTVILTHASADEVCQLVLNEQADIVVTGGIQRRYHEYLTWKKVQVLDSVMGPWKKALDLLARNELTSETVLYERQPTEGARA